MEHSQTFQTLVRQASLGNEDSIRKLVRTTSPKLFSYILRFTLDYYLAKRLTKEVQNEMIRTLWRLNKPDEFWPWIYALARETVKENYIDTRKHEDVFLSDEKEVFFNKQLNSQKIQEDPFFQEQDSDRLFKTVYQAMKKTSLMQRNVLILRCFENMPFGEIARFIDRSEMNTRVLFFRAKQKIKYRLWLHKYRPNRTFLPALGLFGTVTSIDSSTCTPSAVIVESLSIQIGFVPWLIGTLTSKIGVIFSCVTSFVLLFLAFVHLMFLTIMFLLLLPLVIIVIMSMFFVE